MSEQPTPQDNTVFQQSQQPQPQPQQKLSSLGPLAGGGESGFDIPVESVPLPSKGLVYPADHSLHKEDLVDIKCMTAKEEDLLTSSGLIKNGTVITRLLQSCLINKTIDANSLLIGDRNAILIAIRITGYGSEYSAKVTCPDCGESYENEFSLNGLNIKPVGAEPLTPNTNLFSFTLPKSGKEVQFKLLTGVDEAEIAQAEKINKKLGVRSENTVTSRLFYSVVSIGGDTDRTKIHRLVQNMPARDSRALRKYIDKIEPSVQMKQVATCQACNEPSEVGIPLGISFFWPDLT